MTKTAVFRIIYQSSPNISKPFTLPGFPWFSKHRHKLVNTFRHIQKLSNTVWYAEADT